MIKIKSPHELKLMAEAGQIADMARRACGEAVAPGVTTRELDHIARKVIKSAGATPSFLGYGGFPAAICCSVNDEVIHGIPGSRRLREGDLVKIDVGALYRGYHGDCAATFACGAVSEEAEKLIRVTRQSFYEGIKFAREGYRISDISRCQIWKSPVPTAEARAILRQHTASDAKMVRAHTILCRNCTG